MRRGVRAFSWRGLGFGLLAAGIAAGCYFGVRYLYQQMRDRTVAVCVVTDFDYRTERPDWAQRLQPLFTAVNRRFLATGVQFTAQDGGEAYPPETAGPMRARATVAEANSSCRADLILGLTGRSELSDAYAPPFSHILLVEDTAAEAMDTTVRRVSRALATVFGVPAPADSSVAAGAEQAGNFKPAEIRIIRASRNYDFAHGIAALKKSEERTLWALESALQGEVQHPDAVAHRVLGNAFTGGRDYDDAVRQLRDAVRVEPDSLNLHLDLAVALAASSRSEEALNEIKTSLKMDPGSAWPHAAMGVIYFNRKNMDQAVEELEIAVHLEPGNASYRSALGQAYARQPGGLRESSAAFEEARRLSPRDAATLNGLAHDATVAQELAEAVRQAEAVAQRSPGSADAHLKLGLAQAYAGDAEAARKEVARALQLEPRNGPAHLLMARLNYMTGDYAAAARELGVARGAGSTAPESFSTAVQRKLAQPAVPRK